MREIDRDLRNQVTSSRHFALASPSHFSTTGSPEPTAAIWFRHEALTLLTAHDEPIVQNLTNNAASNWASLKRVPSKYMPFRFRTNQIIDYFNI